MTHQVDGVLDKHHGESNAAILPHVMEFNLSACPERFRDIAVTMGEDVAGLDLMDAARRSIDAVSSLLSDIGMTRGALVAELGYDPKLTGAGIDAPGAQMPALQRRV